MSGVDLARVAGATAAAGLALAGCARDVVAIDGGFRSRPARLYDRVDLNSILGKIDRGQGTIGLMLNDPTLYEELKLLVGGAGRSRVVRSLIGLVSEEN